MTKEEKVRRMSDKGLFERCKAAFPKEMAVLKRDMQKAAKSGNKTKLVRLSDKYCALTLKVDPKCEL